MLYIFLFIEISLTCILLYLRKEKYTEKILLINPKGEPKTSPQLVKSGKTNRLNKERDKYINNMVLILAVGMVAVSGTLFYFSHQVVKKHREQGLISTAILSVDVKNNLS